MTRMRVVIGLCAVALSCATGQPSRAEAQGPAPITVTAPEKLGNWRRAETEHFIFYSDGSEKALREDAIKLERFDTLMRLLTKIDKDEGTSKLTIYFVSSTSRVQSLYSGPVKSIAGFYSTNPGGVLAVVPRSAEAYTGGSNKFADIEDVILFHEYAHHLMLQYFPAAYPAWYVEGFAEFIGNARVERDGTMSYGIPNISRAPSLFLGVQLPIEKLLTARVTDLKGDAIGSLYARGWALTHYLNFDPTRKGQLKTYMDAIGKGKASLDAARESFGDLKQLNRALDHYISGKLRYTKLANPFPEPKAFSIAQLSEAESDTVLLRVKLARGTSPKEREPIAQELRKLAALHPGNAVIATSLAEAELDLGNDVASGQAADAALKIMPLSSRALLWKGLSLARPLVLAKDHDAVRWKAARSWIVKANRADPNDPLPLFENYLSYSQAGAAPTEIAIMGLARAVALVPQEDVLRFTYASALAGQKKYDEAIAILGPVANDPHGGDSAEAAQKLIAAITQAKATGTIPNFDVDSLSAEEEKKGTDGN
jgi:tetratricopeptide (TPR) repeat protein